MLCCAWVFNQKLREYECKLVMNHLTKHTFHAWTFRNTLISIEQCLSRQQLKLQIYNSSFFYHTSSPLTGERQWWTLCGIHIANFTIGWYYNASFDFPIEVFCLLHAFTYRAYRTSRPNLVPKVLAGMEACGCVCVLWYKSHSCSIYVDILYI